MNKSIEIILYLILPIPITISFLWALSIAAFGVGLFAPYMIFSELGYGYFRVLIFGSLCHLFFAGLFFLFMKLSERGIGNNYPEVAVIQLVIALVLYYGFQSGWSW